MNNTLSVSIVLCVSMILITGCAPSDTSTSSSSTTSSNTTTNTSSNQPTSNKTVVSNGDTVKVDYVWTLEDGTLFDTSIEAEAKKGNKHQEGRPYEPLTFKVWAGQMIKGFDVGVVGMKIWETKKLTLAPADAYGDYNQSRIIEIQKGELSSSGEAKVGDTIYDQMGWAHKIVAVSGNVLSVDMNHELAGKTLIFNVTVREIQ